MISMKKLNAVLTCVGLATVLQCTAQSYTIEHSPVSVALPGKPLTVRVRLKGDHQSVESVSLLYAASQDAAPFRIAMRSSGPGIYAATVPGNLLSGVDKVTYYIEAADAKGAARETPWYTVRLRAAAKPPPVPVKPVTPAPAPAPAPAKVSTPRPARVFHPAEEDEGWSWGWKETALLAGGGLVAGGLYLWLDDDDDSSSGGGAAGGGDPGGGGSGGTTNQVDQASYAGTVTLSTQAGDSDTTFETRAVTISVSENGTVTSDDLYPGQTLRDSLNGSSFVLEATVDDGGRTGEIQFIGTILDGRIVGSIQGSATSAAEGEITYAGSFSANRQ